MSANETLTTLRSILIEQFHIDSERIQPDASLQGLGLDSLGLMEFVFAVEDHFGLRIPEERLDPRQTGLTLADLGLAIDEAVALRAAGGGTSA